eukprot:1196987-Rhodomonas_salina.4
MRRRRIAGSFPNCVVFPRHGAKLRDLADSQPFSSSPFLPHKTRGCREMLRPLHDRKKIAFSVLTLAAVFFLGRTVGIFPIVLHTRSAMSASDEDVSLHFSMPRLPSSFTLATTPLSLSDFLS